MTAPILTAGDLAAPFAALDAAGARIAALYPGEPARRQPVHTVYGGAHLFRRDTAARLGAAARELMAEAAPHFATFARAVGLPGAAGLPDPEAGGEAAARAAALDEALAAEPDAVRRRSPAAWLAWAVHRRVIEKLAREPVEDFRLDFEDGYGNRPDEEEDACAIAAAGEVAAGLAAGSLPPFLGIRIKSLSPELKRRAIRTLDLFMGRLLQASGGRLPAGFVITLPKVVGAAQPRALATLLGRLEERLGLAPESLLLEIMVETPQAIVGPAGEAGPRSLAAAAAGRCRGVHFGTYDYTASLSITAAHQRLDHPACDFARGMMQVALAGTGVMLADGATHVLPVPPHRGDLSAAQRAENREVVRAAWRLHASHVRHSLEGGYHQGWDLHPGQLPSRFATVYGFFLEGLEAASARLRNFVGQAAQATRVGEVFDDAATGQGLLNYFLRAIGCGAVEESEVLARTGLARDELASRSFLRILAGRQAGGAPGAGPRRPPREGP